MILEKMIHRFVTQVLWHHLALYEGWKNLQFDHFTGCYHHFGWWIIFSTSKRQSFKSLIFHNTTTVLEDQSSSWTQLPTSFQVHAQWPHWSDCSLMGRSRITTRREVGEESIEEECGYPLGLGIPCRFLRIFYSHRLCAIRYTLYNHCHGLCPIVLLGVKSFSIFCLCDYIQ